MNLPGLLYSELARARRRWYARHPEARRRLARPVISVGNLTVGGTGKTPTVVCLARMLIEMGERPSVLSRGYRRRDPVDGVVVVSDGRVVRADLARAGDEPLMLAQSIEGAAVLVSPDRYLAGRLAEARLGCTVHLLDDGFQHLALERDVDLLLISSKDLEDPRPLPGGRLREPLETAALAHALIVSDATEAASDRIARRLNVAEVFRLNRRLGRARLIEPYGSPLLSAPSVRALAVAGIARPDQFFADLRAAGFTVAGELVFRDHHPYVGPDVELIVRHARAARAELVLTTEKDIVRLVPLKPMPIPVAFVPLTVHVEPERFREWIRARLAAARGRRSAGGGAGQL